MSLDRINTNTPAFLWEFPKGRAYFFRCNHRFLRLVEENDPEGRPYTAILFQDDGTMKYWHELLWNLSATHRQHNEPDCTFEEFLDMLPAGADFMKMKESAHRIMREFFTLRRKDEPKPINDPPPEDEDIEGNLQPAPSEPGPPTGDSSTVSSS